MIYDWYIQQHMQAATGLELDDEDFTWQFRGVASDHVNTYMLFEHEKLLVAMETMLDSLESDEATVTRCRQVLTLWITGLDTLARERNSAEILPRVVGQAVEWVREQFDEPASASQPVVQLPRLAA